MDNSGTRGAATYQPVRAPRGKALSCKGRQQEAALRLLMNSLDPEVAEVPEELIAHGGVGARPARDWDAFQEIVASLRRLEDDETFLVDAGKPTGVHRTHRDSPRVVLANTDWSYAGTQSVLPTAYELFSSATHKHFGGTLAGLLVVSGGMGARGGAQPLAATANGAAFLGIDVDAERIKRRVKAGYCDMQVNSLDEALRILKNAVRKRQAASVGLIGNCADVIPELVQRGVVPDLVTDLTSADDPAGGYVPQGLTVEQTAALRRSDARACRERALDSIAAHVRGMIELRRLGALTFGSGNNIRALAHGRGVPDALEISDGIAEYLRPILERGRAPLLWVALSGEPADIARTDRLALELFPEDGSLRKWMALAGRLARFQGLPARAAWLERAGWAEFGRGLSDLAGRGEISGPMAIVCGQATGASVPWPGSAQASIGWDQIVPLLDAAGGAAWISVSQDEDGTAQLSGCGAVADGTAETKDRIGRLLANCLRVG